jgi:hypothetical protein
VQLIIAILVVALITHTWMSGSLFSPLRTALGRVRQLQGWRWAIPRIVARGALCHFCLSHWVAGGLALLGAVSPLVAIATILPANVVLVLFVAATERLPIFIDAALRARGVEMKRAA